jgi:ketosteroid isomerase-like protein
MPGRREVEMRTLSITGGLAAVVILLAACGGSPASSTEPDAQREADLYHVTQIERDWHEATSTQDIDLMMSLWAPDATFTVASGKTLTGKDAIRSFWLEAPVFQPENHWVSETPAYKLRATVNGDKGTLYFECHYVDPETEMVVAVTAADQQVARINGEWLITNNVGANPILTP